jgi:hypothetical protein
LPVITIVTYYAHNAEGRYSRYKNKKGLLYDFDLDTLVILTW